MSTVEDVYRDTVWQPLIAPHDLNLTPTPPSLDAFSPKRQLTHSVVGIVLSLGVPVNMTLESWPHYHSQMVQLFQEGWKWGCCPVNEKSFRLVDTKSLLCLSDLWLKQAGNGKPIELMSYNWLSHVLESCPRSTKAASTQAPYARLGKSRRM